MHLLLCCQIALAQDDSAADAPADPPPEEPEVLVIESARPATAGEVHSVAVLDEAALERAAGQDLAQTISAIPGVAPARGSADSTKPIIRGQPERRLLVLYDGVRHESQKWGLDHATEIDPFSAGEISVIKGAAGVRYGPDAIGGVVLVAPPPLADSVGVVGRAQLVGSSNGRRGVGAARLDWVPERAPWLTLRVTGDGGRGAALHTPTYVLGNTASATWNLGATVGARLSPVDLRATWRHYDAVSGVCYCVRSGSPEEFLSQLDADAPIGAERWTTSADIDRPYQDVTHDLGLLRLGASPAGLGELTVTYAFQRNHREEYEQARASVTGPQYDFLLRTHSVDALLEHHPMGARDQWRGGVGLAGSFQENVYSGLPLIPNFRAFQGGIFTYEQLVVGNLMVSAGARLDALARTAWLTTSAFERALTRGTLDEADCAREETAARCPASYHGATASLGGVWMLVPEHLDLRLDLSSASRFPNADELYMNGSAPTWPVYAVGNPGLDTETTWSATPTARLQTRWVNAEASAYLNQIQDYVYFAPELGADGAPEVDVTIQGAFPRFTYRAIDARFSGLDGGLTLLPEAPLSLEVQAAVVRARDLATGDSLVMIPADRARATLRWATASHGRLTEGSVALSGEQIFEQTHTSLATEIAPPPPGVFLLGASLDAHALVGDRSVAVGIDAANLLNQRYRDYSSLLRYYADEPGRDVRVRVGVDL